MKNGNLYKYVMYNNNTIESYLFKNNMTLNTICVFFKNL